MDETYLQNLQPTDDEAVLALPVAKVTNREGTNWVGLFVIQYDRVDPCWKIPGGFVEFGENLFKGLYRETEEEVGLAIPYRETPLPWNSIGDEHVVPAYISNRWAKSRGKDERHLQHLFAIITDNPKELLHLDGQCRKEDDEEVIQTKIFRLDEMLGRTDFLPPQRALLRQIVERLNKI